MKIARLEPENNLEAVLEGVSISSVNRPFIVIGNHQTNYGSYLKKKFPDPRIRFLGGIYNRNHLDNLRYYSNIYYHGHSVGGTNPSLLEAMASKTLICANRNEFNSYILGDDAFYFSNSDEVSKVYSSIKKLDNMDKVEANMQKCRDLYTYDHINREYINYLTSLKPKR